MAATLKKENLQKRSGDSEASINNRIEDIDATVTENTKHKKFLTQNIQDITIKRTQ